MMFDSLTTDLREMIAMRLASHAVQPIEAPDLRRAAVSFVVTDDAAGQPSIIVTRRPARMGRHAGQWALPGGKIDAGETAEQAALRELDEELGLTLAPDAVIGRLDDYATRSGFCVTPFVLWAGPARPLTPAPDEVDKVVHLTFTDLTGDAIPHFEPGVDPDRPVLYSEFDAIGHSMYSPTAAMVYQFREVALLGNDTRVAHFDQPKFAWR